MEQRSIDELAALLPLLIQLVGLVFAVLVDSYMDKRQKRVQEIVRGAYQESAGRTLRLPGRRRSRYSRFLFIRS